MKKNRISGILFISILFLIPFGINARAQAPDFVGVEVGDEYTWKAEVNFGNVDNLLDNVRSVIVDWQNNLASFEFLGLESLTPGEILEQIAGDVLSNILPVGWESLNVTELIEETIENIVEEFNSTILSGIIPSGWQALNFTDFYNLVVDGINATLGTGWEDNPIPDLYMLMINALNSTLYFGFLPANWETLTVMELYRAEILALAPPLGESAALHMILETMFPTDMFDLTVSEFFENITASGVFGSINATYLFDQAFLLANQTFPGEIEFVPMSDVIDFLVFYANMSMPAEYSELNGSEMLKMGIDYLMSGYLPPEMLNSTIVEMLDGAFDIAIDGLDNTVIPEWDSVYVNIQAMGMSSFQVGLRAIIESIGAEVEAFPGGPMISHLGLNFSVSMDFETWIEPSDLFGPSLSAPVVSQVMFSTIGLLGLFIPLVTMEGYIVDPSTYSLTQVALLDQLLFTGTLIAANNRDWEALPTELTFAPAGNPDAIVLSVEWTDNGVLESATIKTDGLVVAGITLIGANEAEIPGYEIPIILGFTGVTIIAIILYGKKKNRSL